MNKEIIDYLLTQRVGVVAVEMPDGSPHAATVHMAFDPASDTFIIQTNPKYRKAEPLLENDATRVSLVVGLEEIPGGKDKTFQLDGIATVLATESKLIEVYLNKFPEKRGKFLQDIFFVVKPTWWRYTDWGTPAGKTVCNSDGTVTVNGVLVD